MLVSLQTSGSRPPLFFVHGMRGIAFTVRSQFARMLGSDQPLYVITANGLDGRKPIIENVPEMVAAYLQEIRQARPSGPLRIGGMCGGCMLALEIARVLQSEGRETGPVILLDPPVLTPGYEKRQNTTDLGQDLATRFHQEVRRSLKGNMLDPDNSEELPFNPRDPTQMQLAVEVATRTTLALARHVPTPFSGPADVIVPEGRAPGFLHPEMPWRKLLPGLRVTHVLRWRHTELLRAGRKTVARLVKSMLEEVPAAVDVRNHRTPQAAHF
jgi:thioesterase domain-containing protein